jgi:hypothetical protein
MPRGQIPAEMIHAEQVGHCGHSMRSAYWAVRSLVQKGGTMSLLVLILIILLILVLVGGFVR